MGPPCPDGVGVRADDAMQRGEAACVRVEGVLEPCLPELGAAVRKREGFGGCRGGPARVETRSHVGQCPIQGDERARGVIDPYPCVKHGDPLLVALPVTVFVAERDAFLLNAARVGMPRRSTGGCVRRRLPDAQGEGIADTCEYRLSLHRDVFENGGVIDVESGPYEQTGLQPVLTHRGRFRSDGAVSIRDRQELVFVLLACRACASEECALVGNRLCRRHEARQAEEERQGQIRRACPHRVRTSTAGWPYAASSARSCSRDTPCGNRLIRRSRSRVVESGATPPSTASDTC